MSHRRWERRGDGAAERQVVAGFEIHRHTEFSFSRDGDLIDRLTGTGDNIGDGQPPGGGAHSCVLVFILLFLVIELVMMIL